MKRYILLFLLVTTSFVVTAQTRIPAKPIFRSDLLYQLPEPEKSAYVYPDWYYELPPIPENATYVYTKEQGEGATKQEALNRAFVQVLETTAHRLGITVNTADIHNAVQRGEDYSVISRAMKIPVNKVCDFYVQDSKTHRWTVYILCQVAEKGNIDVEWEAFHGCAGHTKYDKQLAYWKKCIEDAKGDSIKAQKKVNGIALAASFFVPGAGQMYKGNYGKGAGILASELTLVGGAITCYFVGKKQLDIMRDKDVEYDAFNTAKSTYNTMRIMSYTFYGVAGALYVFNLCHAYLMRPSEKAKMRLGIVEAVAWYPTIMPINEFYNPSYAVGASMQIKF